MKKQIAILLILFFLFSASSCAREREVENPYRLKTAVTELYQDGQLNSLIEVTYGYNDQGHISQILTYYDRILFTTQTYETDEYGNITRTVTEQPDAVATIRESKLTLDDQHRVIRQEDYEKDATSSADGTLVSVSEMVYDRRGNQAQLNISRSMEGTTIDSWVDYIYDRSGNLIEETSRWNFGTDGIRKETTANISTTKHEYTGNQLIRSEEYNNKGELTYYTDYTYDDTGLIQTTCRYAADSTPYSKTVTAYDEYGNLLSSEYYKLWDDGIDHPDDLVDRIEKRTYEPISPQN